MRQPTIYISAAMLLLFSAAAYAEPTQKLNIDKATVFLSGAELVSTAKVSLNKGETELLFSNVAGDVNSQSIVVNATNGALVESVTFQNNYLASENLSPRVKEIKDSIELMTQQKQPVANKIATLTEQIALLQSNRKVGGENNGLSVVELQKMLELVGNKMEGYLNEKNKQEALLKKTDERIASLRKQLDEEQKKDYQPGGQLLVKFYAKEATTSNITITYVVPHAGWSPVYNIWANDVHSPVKFYYKANIYQNSGVKWNNVRLTLSTGNPQEGMQPPVLSPWYLAFYTPAYRGNTYLKNNVAMGAAPMAAKSEMVVTLDDKVSGEQSTINEYVAVDNSGINTEFDIDLPYTIPNDGQQHLVAVKEYETPATYRHYAVPKMEKDAFLQANITNWEELNLLPGQTNIFYEGTYVGQGYLDPSSIKDTMNISLGRDKKIVIKRERDKKLRSVKMIGSSVRETFAYNITIRNTRKETVTLVFEDQQPVSNDKDIVLEEQDMGGSVYDETTGSMKWTLTLAPNETKKINFGYTLKYPKGKTVAGLPR